MELRVRLEIGQVRARHAADQNGPQLSPSPILRSLTVVRCTGRSESS